MSGRLRKLSRRWFGTRAERPYYRLVFARIAHRARRIAWETILIGVVALFLYWLWSGEVDAPTLVALLVVVSLAGLALLLTALRAPVEVFHETSQALERRLDEADATIADLRREIEDLQQQNAEREGALQRDHAEQSDRLERDHAEQLERLNRAHAEERGRLQRQIEGYETQARMRDQLRQLFFDTDRLISGQRYTADKMRRMFGTEPDPAEALATVVRHFSRMIDLLRDHGYEPEADRLARELTHVDATAAENVYLAAERLRNVLRDEALSGSFDRWYGSHYPPPDPPGPKRPLGSTPQSG